MVLCSRRTQEGPTQGEAASRARHTHLIIFKSCLWTKVFLWSRVRQYSAWSGLWQRRKDESLLS